MSKRKIGWILQKVLVEGDQNLLNKNEILVVKDGEDILLKSLDEENNIHTMTLIEGDSYIKALEDAFNQGYLQGKEEAAGTLPEVPPTKTPEEVLNDIKAGGDITLTDNLYVASNSLTMTKNTNLNLGGKELSAKGSTYGDTVVIGNGASVSIKNGVILPADDASLENQSATVLVKTSVASKLNLEGVEVTGIYPVYLNNAADGTEITIESGEFYSEYELNPAVYVQKGGKVTINGGTFGKLGTTYPYLLNLKDDLRAKPFNQYIEVKGGKFINFDPSNCNTEGPNTNFVAEGYAVGRQYKGTDTIYYVKKDNGSLPEAEVTDDGTIYWK